MLKRYKKILFVLCVISCTNMFGMDSVDFHKLIDGLLQNDLITIVEQEHKKHTHGFKEHIKFELYFISNNKIGQKLIIELAKSLNRNNSIIIKAINTDNSDKCALGPRTAKRRNSNMTYVTLYNRAIESTKSIINRIFEQNQMYGFFINPFTGKVNGDACELVRIDNDLQHITLFHELNHARILIKEDVDQQSKTLTIAEIINPDNGTMNTPIIDNDEKQYKNIFGYINSGMEEFQSIGYTLGKYHIFSGHNLSFIEAVWEDKITENAYRIEDAKIRGLSNVAIRYPYRTVSTFTPLRFGNETCKLTIAKKLMKDLSEI